ncbi:MAG: hypothetical protein WCO63_12170 [Bacteroidota bacterium]
MTYLLGKEENRKFFRTRRLAELLMSRRISFLVVLINLCVVFPSYSQDKKVDRNVDKLEKQALQLFQEQDFVHALPMYSQLLSLDIKNPDLNYRFGVCLLQGDRRDLERPLRFLEKAVKEPGIEPEAYFYLGMAYQYNYRFSDAIGQFNTYKRLGDPKKVKEFEVERQIQMCENGFMLLSNVHDIYVLSKSQVNLLDFYRAYQLKNFGGEFLLKPDFFKSKIDKKSKDFDVMFFPKGQDEVYFSSYGDDRKNGRDIFHAYRQPDGSWGKPLRVEGAINTPYDEAFPYLLPDGKTMYFCSKGHNSMGGYDIFLSRLDTVRKLWMKPENLDFAINTPFDDLLFVSDKSKRIAYFASNRSTTGDQVTVYKVRIDKRPEKSQELSLQPLLAGNERNKANYDRSLEIIREMSRLEVNTGSEALADTNQAVPENPPLLAVSETKNETALPTESLEQKLNRTLIERKEVQAGVDSAFDLVKMMDKSLKDFEVVRAKISQESEKLSDKHEIAVAKAVKKALDNASTTKHAKVENARYRSGLMQQLLATQKHDSAKILFVQFKEELKPADTAVDFSRRIPADLKIALNSSTKKSQVETDFFQGEEIHKLHKDSAFLMSFVDQSISGKTAAETMAFVEKIETNKSNSNVVSEIVDTSEAVAVLKETQNTDPVFEKARQNVSALVSAQKAKLDEWQNESMENQALANQIVQFSLEQADKLMDDYQDLAAKKLNKQERVEDREFKLKTIQNEAISKLARARVASTYQSILEDTEDSLSQQILMLETLENDVSKSISQEELTQLKTHLDSLTTDNISKISPETVKEKLALKLANSLEKITINPDSIMRLAVQSICLDSLSKSVATKGKNTSQPDDNKQRAEAVKSLHSGSVETGTHVLKLLDYYAAQQQFTESVNKESARFDISEKLIDVIVPEEKIAKKTRKKEMTDKTCLDYQLQLTQLSPAAAAFSNVNDPEKVVARVKAMEKAMSLEGSGFSEASKDSVVEIVMQKYSPEIALLEKSQLNEKEIVSEGEKMPQGSRPELGKESKPEIGKGNKPETGKGNKPEIGKGNKPEIGKVSNPKLGTVSNPETVKSGSPEQQKISDEKLMNTAEALSKSLAEGIGQLDKMLSSEVPAVKIPALQSRLKDYQRSADTAIAQLQKEAQVKVEEKGSHSDIAMYLELKEYEIRASRNKAVYLANKLKTAALEQKSGEIAGNGTANLLENDAEVLFSKARIRVDSAGHTKVFLIKKQLLQEAFVMEDTALARQEKAIVLREKLIESQPIAMQVTSPLKVSGKTADKAPVEAIAFQENPIATDTTKPQKASYKPIAKAPAKPTKEKANALAKAPAKATPAKEISVENVAAKPTKAKANTIAKTPAKPTKAKANTIAKTPAKPTKAKANTIAKAPAKPTKATANTVAETSAKPSSANANLVPKASVKLIDSGTVASTKVTVTQYGKEIITVYQNPDSPIPEKGNPLAGRTDTNNIHTRDTTTLKLATRIIIKALPESSRATAEKLVEAIRALSLPDISDLYYTVQVGVYAKPRTSAQLNSVSPLFGDRLKNGYYRYFSGIFGTKDVAVEAKNVIVRKGISDAYVVAIYKGRRLTSEEAMAFDPQSIANTIPRAVLESLVQSVIPVQETKAEFRVQLGAYRKPITKEVIAYYSGKTGMSIITLVSTTRLSLVMTSGIATFDEAVTTRQKAVAAGIADAFLVGYIGDERTTAAIVRQLMSKNTP